MEQPIRLLLADDHQLFRRGLASIISTFDGIELKGEANNGKELIDLVEQEEPDVVLMDLKMPVMDGIEATTYLRATRPAVKIIVISMFHEDEFVIRLVKLGAHGYLLKNSDPEEVERAIRSVVRNDFYFNDHVSQALLRGTSQKRANPGFDESPQLTEREVEVVKLVCKEYTNGEIADMLCLSVRTVEGHRKSILKKIEAKNTAGMIVYAMNNGLFE